MGAWVSGVGRVGFAERCGVWDEERRRLARDVVERVTKERVEVVRVGFVDQHGVVRCKSVVAEEVERILGNGITVPVSILGKDTSDRTVFPVFTREGILGLEETRGAGDVVLVPDPATFRVLPWAKNTGWMLSDLYFPSGRACELCVRGLYRRILKELEAKGFEYAVGLEMEFHVFRLTKEERRVEEVEWPGRPPEVGLTVAGYRLLGETRWDEVEELMRKVRVACQGLGLPLRSMELEFGPCQVEITFGALRGLEAADAATLFRSAARQVLRREGYFATFMARPAFPGVFSAGWHLHQTLREGRSGRNAFTPSKEEEILSAIGMRFMAGLLQYAREASLLACPTITGYKRYRPLSLAPDRICWAVDNKGAMLRVVSGGLGDAAARIENRAGEPAANPYLYMAGQVATGMEGMARELDPDPPTEEPYSTPARRLPRSLLEAVEEFERSEVFRRRFGETFVKYLATIKRAEWERYEGEVSEWEMREYADLF